MKTTFLWSVCIFLLCLLGLNGCSSDTDEPATEVYHLSFEKDYYECPLIGTKSIMVRGGNRDYDVEVANPEIMEVTVDLSSPVGMGSLRIAPRQKGKTMVTVKDNVTHETVSLEVKIVDAYLNLLVANPVHEPYAQGDELFLINNEDRDFYLYDENWQLRDSGSYKFYVDGETPFLELTFAKGTDGKKIRLYDISLTNQQMFAVIKSLLGWDWREYMNGGAVTREVSPIVMHATDTETGTDCFFMVQTHSMPEHVLD